MKILTKFKIIYISLESVNVELSKTTTELTIQLTCKTKISGDHMTCVEAASIGLTVINAGKKVVIT
jgi:hypothetical protein